MLRDEIAIIIHFGFYPKTDIGKGDKQDAMKYWGETSDQILQKVKEHIENLKWSVYMLRFSEYTRNEFKQEIIKSLEG